MSDAVAAALADLQVRHRACDLCVRAGYLDRAHPVFSGGAGRRILLVGQAPGPVENEVARPFAGRAGAELMRWMVRAGFVSEADVRSRVFMTSMTTCFPGRLPGNTGDRRPTSREVALCSPWLDGYMMLLQPRLILCIGTLSLHRFLPGRRLDDVVGHAWSSAGEVVSAAAPEPAVLLPLPHPSGQSRWLNDPRRRLRLDQALQRLRDLLPWADPPPSAPDRRLGGSVL